MNLLARITFLVGVIKGIENISRHDMEHHALKRNTSLGPQQRILKQSAGRATQRAAVLIRASARRRPSSRRVTRISPEAGKTPVSAVILT